MIFLLNFYAFHNFGATFFSILILILIFGAVLKTIMHQKKYDTFFTPLKNAPLITTIL